MRWPMPWLRTRRLCALPTQAARPSPLCPAWPASAGGLVAAIRRGNAARPREPSGAATRDRLRKAHRHRPARDPLRSPARVRLGAHPRLRGSARAHLAGQPHCVHCRACHLPALPHRAARHGRRRRRVRLEAACGRHRDLPPRAAGDGTAVEAPSGPKAMVAPRDAALVELSSAGARQRLRPCRRVVCGGLGVLARGAEWEPVGEGRSGLNSHPDLSPSAAGGTGRQQ
mmetsp:Transcript_14640/g.47855  ORF Transcript_14640/g.47855 Transcript_14640/m.47855 type:complete len:228 (-) Transcript_14640:226-909(-)